MATESNSRAGSTAEKVSELLAEWGIRVPEDIEAEVADLIEKEYSEVEELAWMMQDLRDS